MNFNASNYVVNTSVPSAPRLNVNLATDPAEVVSSACDEYVSAARAYAGSIREVVSNRDYVTDRLAKDLCVSVGVMTDGGINYATNKVALHKKADELYGQAKGTRALSTVANVNAVASNFSSLYDIYYMEGDSSVLTSDYESADKYDARAVEVVNTHSPNHFVLTNPNASGSDRVFETVADGNAVYTISYGSQYPETGSEVLVTSAWLMKDSDNVVVEYTSYVEDLNNVTFTAVSSSSSSDTVPEEPSETEGE